MTLFSKVGEPMKVSFWKLTLLVLFILALAACNTPAPTQIPTKSTPGATNSSPVTLDQPSIMFYSIRNNEASWYVMKPDGSDAKRMSFPNLHGYKINGIRWIPELKSFAVDLLDAQSQDNLYLMDAQGTIINQITKDGFGTGDVVYSEAAKQFAFVCVQQELDICVANPDGTNIVDVSLSPSRETNPQWANTGKSLIFVSDRSGIPNIWSVNLGGSNMKNLSNVQKSDISPSFSPDGQTILFESQRDENSEIYVMNAGGQNPINLTQNPAADTLPQWSPDGQYIAFRSDRDGGKDIYVMKADGTAVVNVTKTPDLLESAFIWSLDSQRIIYSSPKADQGSDIYAVNRDGSNKADLTNSTGDNVDPQWIGN
jgi:TolB protein